MESAVPLFRMEGVSKRYGGVRALDNAELTVMPGRIHAILGENGAGKSTLIKIMAGVVAPDEGRMTLRRAGGAASPTPAAANDAGIVCIFQELSLIPELSVADNIAISNPPTRFGMIDRRAQRRIAEEALARAGAPDIHPKALVKDLPLSRQQMVEIAKALARNPRILILDEATSALTAADVTRVFGVLKRLRSEGLALLYISHRMHEIAELADECTVFRNGSNVATYAAGTKSDAEVVEMMIGREYSHVFPPKPMTHAERQAAGARGARSLLGEPAAGHLALHQGRRDRRARRARRTGPARASACPLRRAARLLRQILVDGKPVACVEPGARQVAGDRHGADPRGPQDRGADAADVGARQPFLRRARPHRRMAASSTAAPRAKLIDDVIKLLAIRTAGTDIAVGALSGGNQQKVVIAKWLMREPRIILLNDPTRGIDVGTKQEMYQLLRKLADAGAAILFYSTDYDELIGCCDRVLVLYDGGIQRELVGAEITEHALIASALNIEAGEAGAMPAGSA